ncbi:MAG: hypothetical protein C5B58_11780 [Acidobacteria bacterium]|nr:MAG: hypothetical protein C5B58_11780 [Acidobacteriota bacterium]
MTQELATKLRSTTALDGFDDFTNEAEGEEGINVSGSVIQGSKLSFVFPKLWTIDDQPATGMRFTCIEVLNVVTKWEIDPITGKGKPEITKRLAPGVAFPDFDVENDKCPKSEWRMSFGKLVGPWNGQTCLYLVDANFNIYTWASPNTTIGSAIALRELVAQIKRVRRLRGSNVYPVVELASKHFPNQYAPDRHRPHFIIVDWVVLGPDRTANVLPPVTTTPELTVSTSGSSGVPEGAKPVSPITLSEDLDDKVTY